MKAGWWDRWWDAVADRGREFLNLEPAATPVETLQRLCHDLMRDTGEAMGTALAREIVTRCGSLGDEEYVEFLEVLNRDFGPDPQRVRNAAEAYLKDTDNLDAFLTLNAAVEPPRQELMRRINRASRGTAMLVKLREHLLAQLRSRPYLRAVDADLRHLFVSWFNRGFLQLYRIDWHSPAHILEKLIGYEAVHAIQGWGDLRRRLADDRRCFSFFHPALPDEPLIFVEVALVQGMPHTAAALLSLDSEVIDPRSADTAVFFSINNCQTGLRGVSFGNLLIKQVMTELQSDHPWIENFVTLSPLPQFAVHLNRLLRGEGELSIDGVNALLGDHGPALRRITGKPDSASAMLELLEGEWQSQRALLEQPLHTLALFYLTHMRKGRIPVDPVAGFHLANGARLERINPYADASSQRIADSYGVMVNYRYDPNEVEQNHEAFMAQGTVVLSKNLAREARKSDDVLHHSGALKT